jgi:hypothetical protein
LEDVQNIDGILKTHGIDSPPRITMIRSHDLDHARTAEVFEGFSGRIDLALLGGKSACPMSILTIRGKERKALSDVPPTEQVSALLPYIPVYL